MPTEYNLGLLQVKIVKPSIDGAGNRLCNNTVIFESFHELETYLRNNGTVVDNNGHNESRNLKVTHRLRSCLVRNSLMRDRYGATQIVDIVGEEAFAMPLYLTLRDRFLALAVTPERPRLKQFGVKLDRLPWEYCSLDQLVEGIKD